MLNFNELSQEAIGELESSVKFHKNEAIAYMNAYRSGPAREAWDYYYGIRPEPIGKGNSSMTDRTVWETVNGSLQDMLNVFCENGQEAVKFSPIEDVGEAYADAATDLVNQVLLRDNDGYRVLHDALKECLVTSAGFIKVYWDTTTKTRTEEMEAVQPDAVAPYLAGLEATGGFKDIDAQITEREDGRGVDVVITYTVDIEGVKIEHVPIEQILINSKAKSVQDAVYMAHHRLMSKEDLLAIGAPLDLVESINDWILGDDTNMATTTWSRSNYTVDLNNTDGFYDNDRAQQCWIFEHFIRTSVLDPLGQTKLYQVFEINDQIFEVNEIDEIPFVFFTPYPTPGLMFGESVWEITRDIQDIRTALMRGMVDNVNNANMGRYLALEGQYNRESLIRNRPGGVVEQSTQGAVQLLPYNQLPAGVMDMLNLTDDIKEQRTGVTKLGMGLDPDVFKNDNAYATVGMMMNAAQNRLRMVCRNVANFGIIPLMLSTYRLIRQNGTVPLKVNTPNGYIYVDPNDLPARSQLNVDVALTPTERNDEANKYVNIYNLILQNPAIAPLYGMQQQRYILSQIMNYAGIKDVDNILLPLSQYKPAPPSPESIINLQQLMANFHYTEAETMKLKADVIQNQEKLIFEQEKAADEQQLNMLQFQKDSEESADESNQKEAELALDRQETVEKHQLELMKMELERQKTLIDALLKEKQIDAQSKSKAEASKPSK